MRNVMPFWRKVMVGLIIGGGSLMLLHSSEPVHDLSIGAQGIWIKSFGTEGDYERFIDGIQYEVACRQGRGELYERGVARLHAIDALRKLDRIDPHLTDDALRLVLEDRANQRRSTPRGMPEQFPDRQPSK